MAAATCDHCGRTMGDFDGGSGLLYRGGKRYSFCHPNAPGRPDCYHLVTVYDHPIGQLKSNPKES